MRYLTCYEIIVCIYHTNIMYKQRYSEQHYTPRLVELVLHKRQRSLVWLVPGPLCAATIHTKMRERPTTVGSTRMWEEAYFINSIQSVHIRIPDYSLFAAA